MQKGGSRYKQLWVKSSGLVKSFFYFFIFCFAASPRFKEPVFPVAGPDQSDGCGDGAVPPLGSVLPLSAQPERDGGDGGHAGRPARLRAAAAAPQHQADEGTIPKRGLFPSGAAVVTLLFQVRDVAALARLSGLLTLNLDGTEVSESGLQHLASHPLLSSLSLAGISVADGNRALQIISGAPPVVMLLLSSL